MGRRSKKATVEKDVAQFTADKENMLKVFQEKKLTDTEIYELDKEFDIPHVSRTIQLPKNIQPISGEDYRDCLVQAVAWRDRMNKVNGHVIELVSYFPQQHTGRSILVGYNIYSKTEVQSERE